MPHKRILSRVGRLFTHGNTEYCMLGIFSALIRDRFVLILVRVDVLVVEAVMEEPDDPTIFALLSMPSWQAEEKPMTCCMMVACNSNTHAPALTKNAVPIRFC
jgi:hypothetical protein